MNPLTDLVVDKTGGDLILKNDLFVDGTLSVLGGNLDLNDRWFLNLDLRWINIETDAKLDGADAGKVKIDPFVGGLNVGYRF